MSDFFGGLRSGIQFPQVVMNQGPLPGAGGLPAPLHETPDARINYNSTLLGDLTPYAYGEPGYLSSQNAYLNIPHKIQKIVPVIYLPEARRPAKNLVDVSHPVDDADMAFVLRLNRNSMFCTGLKNSAMRRAGLGTAIDPLINLCTLNYILSGMQMGVDGSPDNLWVELLQNLDKERFGRRNYAQNPIQLSDLLHVASLCIRPFGIVRGSEKQGGQDEATLSAATWPVSFVVSLTIDGKESNVLNVWHHLELHAGNDLVLRFKACPVRPYTLNHYYKSVKRQVWDDASAAEVRGFVWQLVPDLLTLEGVAESEQSLFAKLVSSRWPVRLRAYHLKPAPPNAPQYVMNELSPWQELGYWHIGRSQVQTGKYGEEEYWHNDLANNLRTNHLDITFQPIFETVPFSYEPARFQPLVLREQLSSGPTSAKRAWSPSLGLERLAGPTFVGSVAAQGHAFCDEESPADKRPRVDSASFSAPRRAALASDVQPPVSLVEEEEVGGLVDLAAVVQAPAEDGEPDWLGRLEFSDDVVSGEALAAPGPASVAPAAVASDAGKKAGARTAKRGRGLGGSLLRADGTSEPSLVGLL